MKHAIIVIFLCVYQISVAQDCIDNRRKFDIHNLSDDTSLLFVGDVCVLDVISQDCRFYIEFTDTIRLISNFLKSHPNIKVEISSHIGLRGSYEANLKLSECRIEFIVHHILSDGVSVMQFTFKGKGEAEPICSENIINTFPTENEREVRHWKNERVEVKILSIH